MRPTPVVHVVMVFQKPPPPPDSADSSLFNRETSQLDNLILVEPNHVSLHTFCSIKHFDNYCQLFNQNSITNKVVKYSQLSDGNLVNRKSDHVIISFN